MKPSSTSQATQLRFLLEADESQIWETLDSTQQRQLIGHLATLWIEYVRHKHEHSDKTEPQL